MNTFLNMRSTVVAAANLLWLASGVFSSPVHQLKARMPANIPGYGYQGCYTEAATGRALSQKTYVDDAMTVEKCAAACNGYNWFGLEYGREVRANCTLVIPINDLY